MDVSTVVRLLVSGSDEGVVAVWSLVDNQLLHALLGHTGGSNRSQVFSSELGLSF